MSSVTLKHSNLGIGLAVTALSCPLVLCPWQKCLAVASCQIQIWVLQPGPETIQLNLTAYNLL